MAAALAGANVNERFSNAANNAPNRVIVSAKIQYPDDGKIEALVAANGGTFNVASAVLFCLMRSLRRINENVGLPIIYNRQAAHECDVSVNPPAGNHDANKLEFGTAAHAYKDRADYDVGLLIASASIGHLSEDNIDNYYASIGMSFPVARVTRWVNENADGIANPMALANIAHQAQVNAWFRYRVTASSGIGLVQRAAQTIPALFSVAEINSVNLYMNTPWDITLARDVPSKALAKAYAVGEVFDFLPAKWYMGEKAVATVSAMNMTLWRAIAKRFKAQFVAANNVEAAETLDELNALAHANQ